MGKQITVSKFRGLVTNPNALTTSDGAMEIAENVNILQPDIISKMRGFSAHLETRSTLYIGGIYEYLGSIYGVISNSLGAPVHYALLDEYTGATLINRKVDCASLNIAQTIDETTLLITAFPNSTSKSWKANFGVAPRFLETIGAFYTNEALADFVGEAAELNQPGTAVFAGKLFSGIYGTWQNATISTTRLESAVAQNRNYVLHSTDAKSYSFSHKAWSTGTLDTSTSGVPSALDCEAVPGIHPTEDRWEGGIAPNCQVSYRVVFGKRYADGTVVLGAPSPICTVINPRVPCTSTLLSAPSYRFRALDTDMIGAAYTGNEVVYLYDWVGGTGTPPTAGSQFTLAAGTTTYFDILTAAFGAYVATGATLSWSRRATGYVNATVPIYPVGTFASANATLFARLYRTVCSLDANTAAVPRFYLVEEKAISITGGVVSFNDTMTDAVLQFQEELYTNEDSQEGEAQASYKYPEKVDCLADYRSCLFLANPKERNNIGITQVKSYPFVANDVPVRYFRLQGAGATITHNFAAHSAGEGSGGNQTQFWTVVSLVAGKLNLSITGQPYPLQAIANRFVLGEYVEIYLNQAGVAEGRYLITAKGATTLELQSIDFILTSVVAGRRVPVAGLFGGANADYLFTAFAGDLTSFGADYWKWSISYALQKSSELLCKAINRSVRITPAGATTINTPAFGIAASASGNLSSLVGSFNLAKREYIEVDYADLLPITNLGTSYFFPDSATKLALSVPDRQGILAVSKLSEPEAIPLLNRLNVGSTSSLVLGMGATRDSLIVIKEDGVFRVTGDTPQNFAVAAIDTTVIILAKGSICALNNFIYGLSNQGVVQISDTGVQIISNPIENLLTPILDSSSIMSLTNAYSSEVDRTYYLSTYTFDGGNVVYAYNYLTQTWTTSSDAFVDGATTLKGRRFQLGTTRRTLYAEARQFLPSDYSQRWSPCFLFSGQIASGTTDNANLASVTSVAPHGLVAGDTFRVSVYLSQAVNRNVASPNTAVTCTVLTAPTPTTMTFSTAAIQSVAGLGVIVIAFASANNKSMVVATASAGDAPTNDDTIFSLSAAHILVESLTGQLAATYSVVPFVKVFTWTLSQVLLKQSAAVSTPEQGKVEHSIRSSVRFAPIDQSEVTKLKQYSTAQVHFRNDKSCSSLFIRFGNDSVKNSAGVIWVSEIYAGASSARELLSANAKVLRTYVPLDASVGTWIQADFVHQISCEPLEVQSVGVLVETETEITTR